MPTRPCRITRTISSGCPVLLGIKDCVELGLRDLLIGVRECALVMQLPRGSAQVLVEHAGDTAADRDPAYTEVGQFLEGRRTATQPHHDVEGSVEFSDESPDGVGVG